MRLLHLVGRHALSRRLERALNFLDLIFGTDNRVHVNEVILEDVHHGIAETWDDIRGVLVLFNGQFLTRSDRNSHGRGMLELAKHTLRCGLAHFRHKIVLSWCNLELLILFQLSR